MFVSLNETIIRTIALLGAAGFFGVISWHPGYAHQPNSGEGASAEQQQERPPNVVVIFCDDMGYGDVGCFGHPTIQTPRIDQMAAEGVRCTQFYVAGNCCTPSRAGLMTGRLPIRTGMCGNQRVLFPESVGGLQAEEWTLAEVFQQAGYATGCVGKWHLGHLPEYLPTRHGFDEYFGIPYSNDMDHARPPLMRGETIIEEDAELTNITQRYTEEAITFIENHQEEPFFLYFPHTYPHLPLATNERYEGTSARGLYGDVVEELDWSVGQVLDAIRERGLAENTLVLFTSDNGPGRHSEHLNGCAGLLRGGKGGCWEGGMREPTVFWWPGTIEPGRVSLQVASTMDLLATACHFTGQELPDDRIYDSHNLMPLFTDSGPTTRDVILYYHARQLVAIRHGAFKVNYRIERRSRNEPELYNLEADPGERWNIANQHPEVMAEIEAIRQEHLENLVAPISQLDRTE